MNTVDLTVAGKTTQYTGPSQWEEVTLPQFEQICKMMLWGQKHAEAWMLLPNILYSIPMSDLNVLFNAVELQKAGLSDELVADALSYGQSLLKTCNWVYDTTPEKKYLVILEDRPGPGDGLKYCTFEEFMYAERCYERFRNGQKEGELLKLMAILHRQRRKKVVGDSDPRLLFQASLVEQHAHKMATTHEWLRLAILLSYEGARQHLTTHFPHVFPKNDPDSTETKKPTGKNPGWFDVALSLAGEDILRFEANNRANVYLVLAMLDKAIQRQEELES